VLVALFAVAIAALSPFRNETESQSSTAAKPQAVSGNQNVLVREPGWRWVYISIALSGLTAMACEVVWTRLLSLMLGGTTYTFSIILAVFLIGLGIGSSVGGGIARSRLNARLMLGTCQLLLSATVAWAAFMLAKSLPYWPINPWLAYSPWHQFQLDL